MWCLLLAMVLFLVRFVWLFGLFCSYFFLRRGFSSGSSAVVVAVFLAGACAFRPLLSPWQLVSRAFLSLLLLIGIVR